MFCNRGGEGGGCTTEKWIKLRDKKICQTAMSSKKSICPNEIVSSNLMMLNLFVKATKDV